MPKPLSPARRTNNLIRMILIPGETIGKTDGSGVAQVWYVLTFAGVVVTVIGTYISLKIMQRQETKEFDERLPDAIARHPVALNPTFILLIAGGIAAVVFGIIAWLVYGW